MSDVYPSLRRAVSAALFAAVLALGGAPAMALPDAATHTVEIGDAGSVSIIRDAAGLWLGKGDDALRAFALPSGFDSRRFELGTVHAFGDRLLVAGIDQSGPHPRLAVLESAMENLGEDAVPTKAWTVPTTAGTEMSSATLIMNDVAPRFLVWLEGDRFDAMAVKAARFEDGAFGTADVISPIGPGTQIALTAATLADGSVMVAWAGYDGNDDEIWWSRTTRNGWSAPARIADDDQVPDVTPALIATDRGALIAWSAYNGRDYRINVAAYRDGVWERPTTLGGRGGTFPTFLAGTDRPTVLYKTAVPRTWTVQQLATTGVPGKHVAVDRQSNRRPTVRIDGDNVTLSWPGQNVRPSAKAVLAAPPAPKH